MIHRAGVLLLSVIGCGPALSGHEFTGALFEPPPLEACTPAAFAVTCPTPSTDLPSNPFIGFNTFSDVNADHAARPFPHGSVAYLRVFWNELEPVEGELKTSEIDDLIARAKAGGQRVALRVMPEESATGAQRVPSWLAERAGGTWGTHNGVRYFSPDYDAEPYLQAVEHTVTALAARYDNDPALASFDVGFVGDTGEWAYTVDQAHLPSPTNARRIIDAHLSAFKHVPVIMAMGTLEDMGEPLRYAVSKGAGWRFDCWGDLRTKWNNTDNFFDPQLAAAGVSDAWRTAPIMLETCGVMGDWAQLGMSDGQLRWVLHWALAQHASIVNNKSRDVPEKWRPAVEEFLRALGYRIVAHRVQATVSSGGVAVAIDLANRGSAPPYAPFRLAVRARRAGQLVGQPVVIADDLSHLIDRQTVHANLTSLGTGTFTLELALTFEDGSVQAVLANEGRRDDGWVPVAEFSVP